MQAVAREVGVRAPSLYKHVADRDALVALVADAAATDLAAHLTSEDGLRGLAYGLRAWAAAQPEAYRLVFSGHGSLEVLAAASAPVVTVGRALGGEAHALEAARLVTAWATGFISMELAGAFQLGGDVEEAFEYGIERLTAAFATR
jgi:AcrR family transcriptional regulator